MERTVKKLTMLVTKVHKIFLDAVTEDELGFISWRDASCLAYNHVLEQTKKTHNGVCKSLGIYALRQEIVVRKKTKAYVRSYDVTKSASRTVLLQLEDAYISFFRQTAGVSRFKLRKRRRASFCIEQDVIAAIDGAKKGVLLSLAI